MRDIEETPIEGLEVCVNKVVRDSRGSLLELMPRGSKNKLAPPTIGNVYASWANEKYTPRAGQYHRRLAESFFSLTGTVFWYFEDFRKSSKTYGVNHGLIIAEEGEGEGYHLPLYPLSNGIVHVRVPPGVYHLYFPLTARPVLVVAIGSRPYDPADYFDPINDKDSILQELLRTKSLPKRKV